MTAAASSLDMLLDALVRDVPDYPKPGVVFKDITPLLADHAALRAVVDALADVARRLDRPVDAVVGIEARGFILAAPVALALGVGLVPVRKAGKLPGPTHQVSYELEYGEATLQIHRDALTTGDRVLVVDDVLATGGTVAATHALIQRCGADVAAVTVLLELAFLSGREVLGDLRLSALRVVD